MVNFRNGMVKYMLTEQNIKLKVNRQASFHMENIKYTKLLGRVCFGT